ncbi:hypothetical protein FQA39_LY08503 [Lamprigera yunnana]|nr:hypothetical protein FQA39_LY08503 [Lamprigera yunnana]
MSRKVVDVKLRGCSFPDNPDVRQDKQSKTSVAVLGCEITRRDAFIGIITVPPPLPFRLRTCQQGVMSDHDIKIRLYTLTFQKEVLQTEGELEKVVSGFGIEEQPSQEQNEDHSVNSDNRQEDYMCRAH